MRLMAGEDDVHGPPSGSKGRIIQRSLGENRREPGRHQDDVPFTQGNFQLVGQAQDHVAAGLRAAGFQE